MKAVKQFDKNRKLPNDKLNNVININSLVSDICSHWRLIIENKCEASWCIPHAMTNSWSNNKIFVSYFSNILKRVLSKYVPVLLWVCITHCVTWKTKLKSALNTRNYKSNYETWSLTNWNIVNFNWTAQIVTTNVRFNARSA